MLFLQNVIIIFHVISCQISSMSFVFIFILIINHLPTISDFLGTSRVSTLIIWNRL